MEESPAVRVFASFSLFIFSDPRSNLEYLYWLQLEREKKKIKYSPIQVGRACNISVLFQTFMNQDLLIGIKH